ncbi:MAG: L-seryl-tRNA(Sec) selenium transferase [Rickettsiales bacterium]|nr:L-seryl-tRNA(Sec) selenium transferase [Rickettsiales bacterium]
MASVPSFRDLPSVDRLLAQSCWSQVPELRAGLRRDACRQVLEALRRRLRAGGLERVPPIEELAAAALREAQSSLQPTLRRVVNATGVVLHTNLGRAPLAPAAVATLAELSGAYCNLEIDLESGARDSRNHRLARAMGQVLGVEDLAVVNNNAAAVYLALCALAGDGVAVAVSRGELVEIGGSFRMPDIMASSGARLMEVGTTNRTRLDDYRQALDQGAEILLKVHRSNFDMVGFTEEVELAELAQLARSRSAVLIYDLGTGMLRSSAALSGESVRSALSAGVDLVLFSGDKLLGGPQAGLIVGRPELVERIRKHPIARMLRPGKLTFLALEATLLAWERSPEGQEVTAAALCNRTPAELEQLAQQLATELRACGVPGLEVEVAEVVSTPGGGSSALLSLPSTAVSLSSAVRSEEQLAESLRRGEPAVLGRIERGRVLLDVRTLLPGDQERLLVAVARLAEQASS